jgi:hypothetical protein
MSESGQQQQQQPPEAPDGHHDANAIALPPGNNAIDDDGAVAVVNVAPEVVASLASLLRPPTDLTSYITKVLAEQRRLTAQMDYLNAKLAEATTQSSEDRAVLRSVDPYVAKLRNARRRVATLQTSLDGTRQRLTRVHQHLKASATVAERQNAALEDELEKQVAQAEQEQQQQQAARQQQ